MKKIIFFILFSGMVFKLKAQQSVITDFSEKSTSSKVNSSFDTIPGLSSIKPKNNLNLLFLPKPKQQSSFLITNNLTASLDRMPIVKPVGNWNMPIVKPDGTVIYTTPVKRLPPVIKPETEIQKLNP